MKKRLSILISLLVAVAGFALWYFVWGPGNRGPRAEPWYMTFVWGRYEKRSVKVTKGPYQGKQLAIAIRSKLKGALAEYNFPDDFAKYIPEAYLKAFYKALRCPILQGKSKKFADELRASLAQPKYGLSKAEQQKSWQATVAWLKTLRKRTLEGFLTGRIYFRYKFGKPDHPGQCAYSYRRSHVDGKLVGYIRLRERSFKGKKGLCGLKFLPSTLFHEMLHINWPKSKSYPPIPQFSVMFRLKQWRKGNPKATAKAAELALAKLNGALEEALVSQLEKACLAY